MFCTTCGKDISKESKFCPFCGSSNDLATLSINFAEDKKSNSKNSIQSEQHLWLGIGCFLAVILVKLITIPELWSKCGSVAITSINIFQTTDLINGKYEGIACTGVEKSFVELVYGDLNWLIIDLQTFGFIVGVLGVCMAASFARYFKLRNKM